MRAGKEREARQPCPLRWQLTFLSRRNQRINNLNDLPGENASVFTPLSRTTTSPLSPSKGPDECTLWHLTFERYTFSRRRRFSSIAKIYYLFVTRVDTFEKKKCAYTVIRSFIDFDLQWFTREWKYRFLFQTVLSSRFENWQRVQFHL